MKLLTVTEVASSLSISESLVYRLKDEGKLRCVRIGKGAIRFSEEDVMEYLNSCVIQIRLEPGKAPSRKGKPFVHLNGERLLESWQRRGVRIDRQGGRNVRTSE